VQHGLIPEGYVNSVVLNDYRPGGCIVAHIDPPQLFDRPIFAASFFDPGSLVFGASFDPERSQAPLHSQHLPRGSLLTLDGYSANQVTHGMRPEDMSGSRRVSVVLRHVRDDAPKVRQETPMTTSQRSMLIRQVQGRWRDPNSHFFFAVQSLRVMVYRVVGDQANQASKNTKVIDVKLHATWNLQPTECGLLCNGSFLDDNGVTPGALFWRRRHVQAQAKNVNDGITWHRLEEDLEAIIGAFNHGH